MRIQIDRLQLDISGENPVFFFQKNDGDKPKILLPKSTENRYQKTIDFARKWGFITIPHGSNILFDGEYTKELAEDIWEVHGLKLVQAYAGSIEEH